MASDQGPSSQLTVLDIERETIILEKVPPRRSSATPLSMSFSSCESAR